MMNQKAKHDFQLQIRQPSRSLQIQKISDAVFWNQAKLMEELNLEIEFSLSLPVSTDHPFHFPTSLLLHLVQLPLTSLMTQLHPLPVSPFKLHTVRIIITRHLPSKFSVMIQLPLHLPPRMLPDPPSASIYFSHHIHCDRLPQLISTSAAYDLRTCYINN